MTSGPRLHRYTFREYLTLEESSSVRHEFFAGEIYAMAGGTPQHAALAVAISGALLAQTRGGPCRVHSSELRIRVLDTGLTTYPDVTVVCGPYQADAQDKNTLVNPRLVVEITSDSTEEYDRGEKLASYQRIASLDAIVLASHREACRALRARRRPKLAAQRGSPGSRLRIVSLGAELSVDEIYAVAAPM